MVKQLYVVRDRRGKTAGAFDSKAEANAWIVSENVTGYSVELVKKLSRQDIEDMLDRYEVISILNNL